MREINTTGTGEVTEWDEKKLLKAGITGSVILAICCFTPILVILLGIVGLSAIVGWLDYVLLPGLGVFLAITGYSVWKRRQAN